tara:strand:+ start:6721 stop:6936 length:216 start_codon:yes stop_codon:yes gene_type:complete
MRFNIMQWFMQLPISYWIGFGLLIWFFIDLARSKSTLWQTYERKNEPTMYWLTMTIWLALAITCFIYPAWV